MKKLLCALCALTVMMLSLPAGAAELPTLYRLMTRTENGAQTCVATAVALVDGATLTTADAALRAGNVTVVADGETLEATQPAPSDRTGLATLTLAESAAEEIAPGEATGGMRYLGALADGSLASGEATAIQRATWRGQEALLLSAREGLCPGAVLLNAQGDAAAMIVAGYGEGVGRYVALPLLSGAAEQSTWLTDVALRSQGGYLTVDWSGSAAQFDENSAVAVYFFNENNLYYFYDSLPASAGEMKLPLVPGEAYRVWALHHHGEASYSSLPTDAPNVTLAAEAPRVFNKFGYQDEALYLAALPVYTLPEDEDKLAENASGSMTVLPRAERVTAEELAAGEKALYLQARSKYRAKKEQEALLVWTLTTPEGFVLWESDGFIFLPELDGTDDWSVDLTEMLQSYAAVVEGAPAAGRYTVAYYLDGAKAGEIAFTVE